MKTSRRYFIASSMLLVLFLSIPVLALPQSEARTLTANGDGKLKVGREQFKISAVVVKLMEGGNLEISIVSEITVFVGGKWQDSGDPEKGIDLQITGGATAGGFQGSGKLFLSKDGTSIVRLNVQGASTITKRQFDVKFTAK